MAYPIHSGGPSDTVSVSDASTLIFAEDSKDQFRSVSNPSTSADPVFLWISMGTAAVEGQGRLVGPGESYEWNATNMTCCAIYGITDGDTLEVGTQRGL
jgi:hypothetical protein